MKDYITKKQIEDTLQRAIDIENNTDILFVSKDDYINDINILKAMLVQKDIEIGGLKKMVDISLNKERGQR